MAEQKPGNLTRVGAMIEKSMDNGFLALAREMVRVFEVWEEAVGPYNAARSRPESVKNGRLTVLVEGSAWIEHFGYFKTDFIERINQALGGPVIRDIVFRSGPVESNRKARERKPVITPEPESPRTIPPRVAEAVDGIEDDDLKNRLKALMSRQSPHRK